MAVERMGGSVDRRTALRLGGAGALGGGLALAAGTATSAASKQQLDGLWRTTLTRTLPAPNPIPNRRWLTCTADGVALLGGPPATTDAAGTVYRDLGQGQWWRTGDLRFSVSIVIGNFGPDGAPLYETVVLMDVTLAPGLEELTGTYHSDDLLPDGAVRATRDGEISAVRVRFSA